MSLPGFSAAIPSITGEPFLYVGGWDNDPEGWVLSGGYSFIPSESVGYYLRAGSAFLGTYSVPNVGGLDIRIEIAASADGSPRDRSGAYRLGGGPWVEFFNETNSSEIRVEYETTFYVPVNTDLTVKIEGSSGARFIEFEIEGTLP